MNKIKEEYENPYKICWSENPNGYPLYKNKEPNKKYSNCQKIISKIETQNKK